MTASAPVFRDGDGTEHALGPLELALVKAVLGLALRMRRSPRYEATLEVRRTHVEVRVTLDLGDVQIYAGAEGD